MDTGKIACSGRSAMPNVMHWLKRLGPGKDQEYYDLLDQDAANLVESARELVVLMEDPTDLDSKAARMRDLEHLGDSITHEIKRRLDSTFVTPLDKEDLNALIDRVDDVVDFMEEVVHWMADVRIVETQPAAVEIAELLPQATALIQDCFRNLRSGHLRAFQPRLIQIHELENRGDLLFRRARAALAQSDIADDFRYRWDYIYTNLENAVDGCERLADVLEGISNKYA
jgi:uncharacterized protein Yka (UPF0111/DUF47 family)